MNTARKKHKLMEHGFCSVFHWCVIGAIDYVRFSHYIANMKEG
jgi:hypothetical protein